MDDPQNRRLTRGPVVCLLAVFCCALWGSAFPGIKAGYRLFRISAGDFPSQILFAGFRFFAAGLLVVWIGSLAGRRILLPRRRSWGHIFKLCLFQTVVQYIFFYIGLAHASGVKSSIIEGSSTFVAILLACLAFRQEKLTARKVIGCVLGFGGVILVNLRGGLDLHMSFLGEGFVFFSAVSYAVSSVLIKSYAKKDSPVMLSGYQFLCGGFLMILIGFACGGKITHMSGTGIAVLIYLAFVSAAAYSIWGLLLKYNPISRVTIWGFTNPIFGVVLSMIFLREGQQSRTLQLGLALLLVCAGIYIVNRGKPRRGRAARKTE